MCVVGSDYFATRGSLPAVAVHVAESVRELRRRGAFPRHACVNIDVGPAEETLDVLVEGLSANTESDLDEAMTALRALSELAAGANVVEIDGTGPPLFLPRILAVDDNGTPFAGAVGVSIGRIRPMVGARRRARRRHR
ncbi:hypothetical protein BAY60_15925 [Prauserella muralis]|uniref:Uncharacterized protein n=1 Tax=Prauserella muralis TaxID=588067 RepID=A0A2V4B1C9_9PSEU|nr:hypothetical protein BAY60_15925 [Prauserella muralis]